MMKSAGDVEVAVHWPARWIALAVTLLVLASGAWALLSHATEVRTVATRLVRQFRGPALPAGFASGNGRIEATEYDIATKRRGPDRCRHGARRRHGGAADRSSPAWTRGISTRTSTRPRRSPRRRARTSGARSPTITQRESEVQSAVAGIAQRQSDRRRAEAAVAQRRSSVEKAQATIVQRESELALARKELQRSQSLFDGNLIARQKLDEDLTRVETAVAALAQERAARHGSPRARCSRPRPSVQMAEAALVQQEAQREAAGGGAGRGEDRRRLSRGGHRRGRRPDRAHQDGHRRQHAQRADPGAGAVPAGRARRGPGGRRQGGHRPRAERRLHDDLPSHRGGRPRRHRIRGAHRPRRRAVPGDSRRGVVRGAPRAIHAQGGRDAHRAREAHVPGQGPHRSRAARPERRRR